MTARFWLPIALAAAVSPQTATADMTAKWSPVIKGPMGGNLVNCLTFRKFDDDTILMLQTDRQMMQQGELAVKLTNQNWSIDAGDDLPELTFRDANGWGIRGLPVATSHGMTFHIGIEPLMSWTATLAGEPFVLMRESQPLARLDSSGLTGAVQAMRACGLKAFKS